MDGIENTIDHATTGHDADFNGVSREYGAFSINGFLNLFLFPLLSETNRRVRDVVPLSLLSISFCGIQFSLGGMFEFSNPGINKNVKLVLDIVFYGLGVDRSYWKYGKIIVTCIDIMIVATMFGLFMYWYSKRIITLGMCRIMRYFFGIFPIMMIYPNFVLLFCSLADLTLEISPQNIFFSIFGLFGCILEVIALGALTVPLGSPPNPFPTAIFLWYPENIFNLLRDEACAIGLYQFMRNFNKIYTIIPIAMSFYISLYGARKYMAYIAKRKIINPAFASLGTTSCVSAIFAVVGIFVEVPNIIKAIVLPVFFVISLVVLAIRMFRHIPKVVKELQYSALPNDYKSTDKEREEYFDSIGFDSIYTRLKYLILGIENACPLVLDWSLSKYLIQKFPKDNTILVISAWWATIFPGEVLYARALNKKLDKMIQPCIFHQAMRYQLHKVILFNQTSMSSESKADYNNVIDLSGKIVYEKRKFWSNAMNPHNEVSQNFYSQIYKLQILADGEWIDLLDKYPNNYKFREKYAQYLCEGKCLFKESLKNYHKYKKMERGKNRSTQPIFKAFIVSFPYYLKKKIVDKSGNILITKKINKTKDVKESDSVSEHSKSSSDQNITDTELDDDSDSDVDITEAEKFIPKAHLRMAFADAANNLSSPVIKKFKCAAITKIIAHLIFIIIVFITFSSILDNLILEFQSLYIINDVEQYVCGTGLQLFWLLSSSLGADYNNMIMGSQNSSATSFFNPHASSAATLNNITIILNRKIDALSHSLYYQEHDMSEIIELREIITKIESEGCYCKYSITNGNVKMADNYSSTLDKNLRSFVSRGPTVSSMTNPEDILRSEDYCEMYGYFYEIQNEMNIITENRSTFYSSEFSNYYNSTNSKSIYLGDNYSTHEYNSTLSETPEYMSISDTITVFMSIIPFFIFVFTVPIIIYISSGFPEEIQKGSKALLSMSHDVCQEASRSILSDNDEQKTKASSATSESTTIPLWLFEVLITAIMIALLIVLMTLAQNELSMMRSTIEQFNLFMQLRNSLTNVAFSSQFLVLLNMKNKGELGTLPLAPFLDMNEINNNFDKSLLQVAMLSGIIDIGSSVAESAIGFSELVDSTRYSQKCDFVSTSSDQGDFFMCLSFDRAISLFISKVKEVSLSLSTQTLNNSAMIDIAGLLNTKILPGFDELMNSYNSFISSEYENFRSSFVIIIIILAVIMFFSFFLELVNASRLYGIFYTFKSIMLRINPISFVQNQEATSFLLNRSLSSDNQMISAAHSVFVTSSNALIFLNEEAIIDRINPACSHIFKFTDEQILGQYLTILIPKESDDKGKDSNYMLYYTMDLMKSGQSSLIYESNVEGVKDDGSTIPLKVTLIGFAENDRNAESFALMFKDMTEDNKRKFEVEAAKKQSDELLLKILPPDIIRRLQRGEKGITMIVPSASVIFIDIVQFSSYMSSLTAAEIMGNLNTVFTAYDEIISTLPLITKIKLIGDVYMAASGLFSPDEPAHRHAAETVQFGVRAITAIDDINKEIGSNLAVRIGVNSGGPIIAGVLGTEKPLFDIIGDTINVAARLQSTDIPGRVQISQETYELIASDPIFHIEPRGKVFLKGKGEKMAYLVFPPKVRSNTN